MPAYQCHLDDSAHTEIEITAAMLNEQKFHGRLSLLRFPPSFRFFRGEVRQILTLNCFHEVLRHKTHLLSYARAYTHPHLTSITGIPASNSSPQPPFL